MQKELDNYLSAKGTFTPYFEGLNVLVSALYKKQLQEIINGLKTEDEKAVKYFQMYLDTIIINMHTKAKKYKKSLYFNDENVKDIENQGYIIPFYLDENQNIYVLLGIVKNS